MSARWTGGNRFTLLENGEEFFPAVFQAMPASPDAMQFQRARGASTAWDAAMGY